MASKYAKLKGKVPRQPTERDENIIALKAERAGRTLAQLTEEFNARKVALDDLAKKAKAEKECADALTDLILGQLNDGDLDAARQHGYTWSESTLPYAVVTSASVKEVIQWFKDNDLAEQLDLTVSELGERVQKVVKAEAEANELLIEIEKDEATGEERTVAKSKIPGVRVFLKPSLSRVKSGKGE